MGDLSVVYMTANRIPEAFARKQRQILIEAIGDAELVSVSREPLDFGANIIDQGPLGHANMYAQLLRAAKACSNPYVAVAEDDVLYSREHFTFYRPPEDTVAYDMSRWSLFTWKPMYSLKQRISNCTMIAPRKLLIEALTERFEKYSVENFPPHFVSEIGRNSYERQLGVTQRKRVMVYAEVPCIQFNHPNGTDSTGRRKRLGQIKAIDIPHWGRADELAKLYG